MDNKYNCYAVLSFGGSLYEEPMSGCPLMSFSKSKAVEMMAFADQFSEDNAPHRIVKAQLIIREEA